MKFHTLQNSHGMRCKILSYGALVAEWSLLDDEGKRVDMVLGFSEPEDYLEDHPYFGTTTGRVAGRISDGKFHLGGKHYELAINDPPNHLHGGIKGLDKRHWEVKKASQNSISLHYHSPDGEEGYPGNVDFFTTYHLNDEGALSVVYEAQTDAPTPINLTNHMYFNLRGEGNGDILDHRLTIASEAYVSADSRGTLQERLQLGSGRGCSFLEERTISQGLSEIDHGHGDLYFLSKNREIASSLQFAARLHEPSSGRTLEVHTTSDYLQLYLGKHISSDLVGKQGRAYGAFAGLCLECQGYPDGFGDSSLGNIILQPGRSVRSANRIQVKLNGDLLS